MRILNKCHSFTNIDNFSGAFVLSLILILITNINQNRTQIKIKSLNQIVGVDLNSENLIVTSDGEFYKNPKFFVASHQ